MIEWVVQRTCAERHQWQSRQSDACSVDVPPAQPAIAPHQPHAVCRGVACLSAGAL